MAGGLWLSIPSAAEKFGKYKLYKDFNKQKIRQVQFLQKRLAVPDYSGLLFENDMLSNKNVFPVQLCPTLRINHV